MNGLEPPTEDLSQNVKKNIQFEYPRGVPNRENPTSYYQ